MPESVRVNQIALLVKIVRTANTVRKKEVHVALVNQIKRSNLMSYFSDNSIEEEERRNNAFKMLCSLREAVSIARRTQQPIPYRKTLGIINDINPELGKELSNLLTKTNESEIVKYFKQKAALINNIPESTKTTAQELIEKEIVENKILLTGSIEEDTNQVSKRIMELEAALEFFTPEDISENSILNHDFTLAAYEDYFSKKLYQDEKIRDYSLSDSRTLRLRLLHPDKAERIIGTDLIYEQFDLIKGLVRFIHLQYKTWNTKTLYLNGNLLDQVDRLEGCLCNSGYCDGIDGRHHSDNYRFPYCSAFLRPTTKLEKPDANLFSTGDHVPICMLRKIQANDDKLTNRNIRGKSLSHKIFCELFIENLIGSKWMRIDELEKFYEDKGINSYLSRIRVHAQEVISETEAQRIKRNRRD